MTENPEQVSAAEPTHEPTHEPAVHEAVQPSGPTQALDPAATESTQPIAAPPLAFGPAASEPLTAAPPQPKPKKKRTISTTDLFAGALLLAILGGTAVGYTVQALRSPTSLPPLAVAGPTYPPSQIYTGARPPSLPAAQDDATVVGGDLTKLLLPTPSGATVPDYAYDHSWQGIASAADYYSAAADRYRLYLNSGVTRIANTGWKQGDVFMEIQIFQYAPGSSTFAVQQETNAAVLYSGDANIPMPDGVAAQGREYKNTDGMYTDYATAVHGDLAVVFYVDAPNGAPDPKIIDNLITQQMARL